MKKDSLLDIRKRIDRHIKNSYLKRVGRPSRRPSRGFAAGWN